MKPPKSPDQSSLSTREWWSCAGIVYFLAVGDPFIAIKIGVAAQTGTKDLRSTVKRRLDQIQSSNHEPVQLFGLIYFEKNVHQYPMWQAEALERELHNEFQSHARFARDTRGSEWLNVSDDLIKRIQEIATSPESLGLPRFFCSPIVEPRVWEPSGLQLYIANCSHQSRSYQNSIPQWSPEPQRWLYPPRTHGNVDR